MGEERMGRSVELRDGDDIAAVIGEVDDREMQRRLAGRDRERPDAALELRYAPLEHRARRIADPAIAEALDLEIEERRPMVGAVEFIGDGLIDRHRDGFGRGLGLIAAMQGYRLASHLFTCTGHVPRRALEASRLGHEILPPSPADR